MRIFNKLIAQVHTDLFVPLYILADKIKFNVSIILVIYAIVLFPMRWVCQ